MDKISVGNSYSVAYIKSALKTIKIGAITACSKDYNSESSNISNLCKFLGWPLITAPPDHIFIMY